MSAYIIADVQITDAQKMANYREWSTRAMQEHGAEVLVRGGAIEVLEGPWSPERIVVLRFENAEKARAYYASETYTHARSLREGAGVMRMILVEGVA
jgi:uncharacterized protein (DUF1330 family)